MKIMTSSAAALILSAGLASAAHAAQSQVDISGLVNGNIQTYTNGNNYPLGPSSLNVNGVDFSIAPYPGGGTGVIALQSATDTYTISVDETGIKAVYTLINSGFGEAGFTTGTLTFADSSGDSFSYDLTEGDNIRDHYDGDYVNVAPAAYGTASFAGGVRLDAQQIVLPTSFWTSELTTITFAGAPDYGNPNGEPFLAAVTTSTTLSSPVPETSTWVMMIFGFAGLGWLGTSGRRAIRRAAA
jgi:hypothetical protein